MTRANRKRGGTASSLFRYSRPPVMAVVFLVGFCLLMWWWVDAASVLHYLRMKQELEVVQGEIHDLENSNEVLRKEIHRLEHSSPLIEELARERLGFVKEGEIVYQLVDSQ